MSEQIPTPSARVARFEQLGYGMFIHWGLYSLLGRGEWVRKLGNVDHDEYDTLIGKFTAKDFDGRTLARIAREAGMRYITLTTRHHDGFSLYDTRGLSEHDAPHSPAGRDLVADFVEGCRAEGIIPFFYHTTLDWRWKSDTCDDQKFEEYLQYLVASVEVLCTQYGQIGGLWFDGNWSRNTDWKEGRLYEMIRRHQPEAMIINNTGLSELGKLGHPEIDSTTFEQGLPKPVDRRGHPKYVAGEMCQTMNQHWGFGAKDFRYLSPGQVIENLCHSRGAGANYLLNVGPTGEGAIPYYETAVLRRVGEWARMHESILYSGKPESLQCQGRDFVLNLEGDLYYFVFDLNISGHADVTAGGGAIGPRAIKGLDRPIRSVRWMDNQEVLKFAQGGGLATIDFTGYPYGSNLVVRVAHLEME